MTERTEPTEEIIKREIAAAREILRSDRHHAAITGLTQRFDEKFPAEPKAPEGTPQPPKAKEPSDSLPAPKPSLWWGGES